MMSEDTTFNLFNRFFYHYIKWFHIIVIWDLEFSEFIFIKKDTFNIAPHSFHPLLSYFPFIGYSVHWTST